MKRLRILPALICLSVLLVCLTTTGCNSDDDDSNTSKVWDKYSEWRDKNNTFFAAQRDSIGDDGKLFYTSLIPSWNPKAEVLIHYFGDRNENAGNLSPMLTSTCDVIYSVKLLNGTQVDSSYDKTEYGRGIARFNLQKSTQGFAIALMDMHVGDSVQVLIPYTLAYGASTQQKFLPFSNLVMNIRLVDIPFYEIRQ